MEDIERPISLRRNYKVQELEWRWTSHWYQEIYLICSELLQSKKEQDNSIPCVQYKPVTFDFEPIAIGSRFTFFHFFILDTVYFHLPSLSEEMKCVYGVSCYRQIEAKVCTFSLLLVFFKSGLKSILQTWNTYLFHFNVSCVSSHFVPPLSLPVLFCPLLLRTLLICAFVFCSFRFWRKRYIYVTSIPSITHTTLQIARTKMDAANPLSMGVTYFQCIGEADDWARQGERATILDGHELCSQTG